MTVFKWDKSQDQVFTVNNELSSLIRTEGMYDKDINKSFTMDALGKTITLIANASTDITISWPSKYDSGTVYAGSHASILIKNGEFYISEIGAMNFGGADDTYPQFLKLKVSNDSIFKVGAKYNIKFQSLGGNSNIEESDHIFFEDNAQFEAAVHADGVMNFVSGTIDISGSASALFISGEIFLGGGDQRLEAPFLFRLRGIKPVCEFRGHTGQRKLFNFQDKNTYYPEGLFNFHAPGGGKFIFDRGYTNKDFTAMIERNLIAYNGGTDPEIIKDIVNCTIDNKGIMTISLNSF
ncbi:hypothetical protein ACGVWS_07480 [Enterobacteriaceae bacterium LUAb1]